MYAWLGQHWPIVLVANFVYSAIVSGMPAPEQVPQWGAAYGWIYRSAHSFAGNITTAFPRLKQ